jgi:hypothetical protein
MRIYTTYETKDHRNHFRSASCNDQYHFGTNDDGKTWRLLFTGKNYFFTTIYISIIEPQALFAGTRNNGVLYSFNQDKEWQLPSDFTKF